MGTTRACDNKVDALTRAPKQNTHHTSLAPPPFSARPSLPLDTQHAPVYTIGKRGSSDDFRGGVEVRAPVRRAVCVCVLGGRAAAAPMRTRCCECGLAPLVTASHKHSLTTPRSQSLVPPTQRLTTQAVRAATGADIALIPRGGETTFHGPGQLVAYPILDLRSFGMGARAYVESLEDAMIAVAGAYGVAARGRVPGRTGVWVGERKLGAVGVRISRGTSSHGLALNVDTDLAAFAHIVPCGAPDKLATSLAREVGTTSPLGLSLPAAMLTRALAKQWRCGDVLPRIESLTLLHRDLEQLERGGGEAASGVKSFG